MGCYIHDMLAGSKVPRFLVVLSCFFRFSNIIWRFKARTDYAMMHLDVKGKHVFES